MTVQRESEKNKVPALTSLSDIDRFLAHCVHVNTLRIDSR